MMTEPEDAPERLDAHEHDGSLIVAEHRGRYRWAAQLAHGLKVLDAGCGTGYGLRILTEAGAARVTGVDISPEAIAKASESGEDERVEILQADVGELPFSDGEFDLVICFEVIEHVPERERVLDELARVLGTDGMLCISTPNRRVYPPGNPFHIHEYEPDEFARALSERFPHVELHRQTAWLASAILSDEESATAGTGESFSSQTVKTEPKEPGEEIFTVAMATRREMPLQQALLSLGEPFEVRWWEERLDNVISERDHERAEHHHERANGMRERQELGSALLAVETDLANAQNQIAQLRATDADVKKWAMKRDELAQRSEHDRLASEQDRIDFENRLRRAERTIDDITSSVSWRVTSLLRIVKRLLGGR